ncbi:alpha/beta fold hydrolase [Streptomyces sp. NPDC097617]|uniref:alpha/beta fold hydrolase n=1 Tax=Streptomyces sp. NPDC097617 TaxID=3366091 RepID=UPI003802FA28
MSTLAGFTTADLNVPWRGAHFPCRLVTPHAPYRAAPLLILGGGFQDRYSWGRLERRLGHLHPMIIPDLPPAHPPVGPHLTWADLTEAAIAAADHARFDVFAALGGSSGYPIAYRLAQQHPGRITHVLLFGASPRPSPALTALITRSMRRPGSHTRTGLPDAAVGPQPRVTGPRQRAGHHEDAANSLVDILTNARAGRDILPIRAAARLLRNQLAAAAEDPLARYVADRGRLLLDAPLPDGRITGIPCLVGVGEHDTVTTIDDNRAVAATIDNAVFTIVADADHLLYLEQDAEFAGIVTRFLTPTPCPRTAAAQ